MTSPTTRRSSARRRRGGIRRLLAGQLLLWDRTLTALEPWQAEGPLRWRGGRLDGEHLSSEFRSAPLDR